ncbi:MAG: hypothetical protein IPK55_13590 [Streptococcus sp.]|nr:hypothetical protein [Streptococcus sp.]
MKDQFLVSSVSYIKSTLYLDMPNEHSSSLFEILRLIIEMFGEEEYFEKASMIHVPKGILG